MKRFASLALVGSFALLSIASIDPSENPLDPVEPPAWEEVSDLPLSIGRGWEDFRAYSDGQAIPVTSGFQGGQHVHVTMLSAALVATDSVAQVFTWYVDPTDERVLDGAYKADGLLEPLPAELVEAGYGEVGAPFATAFLQKTELVGEEVELRIHVDFEDGRIARASTRGVLEFEWDSPDWAEWICLHEGGGSCLDAGPRDGGIVDIDGGAPIDAGEPLDGGLVDAGDGGAMDGGAVDGGGDAGPTDAGPTDAG